MLVSTVCFPLSEEEGSLHGVGKNIQHKGKNTQSPVITLGLN